MINKKLIVNKLQQIAAYFKEMEPILKFSRREIVNDSLKLRALERGFQLIVDTMVDINTHLISESEEFIPDDYFSTFLVLAKIGVLPEDFALRLTPVVGMRNRIVHKYEDFDQKKFIDDLKNKAGDFKEYCRYVEKFIGSGLANK